MTGDDACTIARRLTDGLGGTWDLRAPDAGFGGRLDQQRDAALVAAVNEVIAALAAFFADGHVPRASLVHGDLSSGNWGMLADGAPVIYDPAVSWSDAEAELAMMELFGTPPGGFWPAYRDMAGLHPGYQRRRGLYQLYHLLSHTVLFGGSHARQALRCAAHLLDAA